VCSSTVIGCSLRLYNMVNTTIPCIWQERFCQDLSHRLAKRIGNGRASESGALPSYVEDLDRRWPGKTARVSDKEKISKTGQTGAPPPLSAAMMIALKEPTR
jgi:hypothetical protein